MTTPYQITLNDVALSDLDETICVTDIREDAPVMRSTAADMYGGGKRLLRHERESLSVQASFAIQEPDRSRRAEIFRSVLAWAENGGILTISGREGQQLHVICTAPPVLHAEDWTETLILTFTTTTNPYWEDVDVTYAAVPTVNALTLPGNAGNAPVSVYVANRGSETMRQLVLTCGSTRMAFGGLSVAAGATFRLLYEDGILTAETGGESQLRSRTADSDDLLLAPCGQSCVVHVSADQSVSAVFSARGRYL